MPRIRHASPLLAVIFISVTVACGPGPARPGTGGVSTSPGKTALPPGAERSDTIEREEKRADINTPRWPRAGKPALCEQRWPETSGDLDREVQRAIDRRAVSECARRYRTDRTVVELSFTVAEDGRIVLPHARGIDFSVAACIERAVEDSCVGIIVDRNNTPVAMSFTLEMYLSQ